MIQVRSRPAPAPLRQRLTTVALASALALTSAVSVALSQSDGTGADTSSVSTDCVIHRADTLLDTTGASPGAATPAAGLDEATPVAEPTAAASPVMPMASPVTGAATPVASAPVPDGIPIDANTQVQTDVEITANVLFTCFNDGEFIALAGLISPTARGAMFGIGEPIDAVTFTRLAATLPSTERTLLDLSGYTVVDDTTVTIDVTYTAGTQLFAERWTLVQQRIDGLPAWVLDATTPIAPAIPEGASTIDLTIASDGYTISPETVSGPDVVLQVTNTSTTVDHEALVLRLADNVSTSSLLQSNGGMLPEGITLVGQATFAPGGEGLLVLVGLEPGTYTIVDLLPGPDGLPNLRLGLETTFIVED